MKSSNLLLMSLLFLSLACEKGEGDINNSSPWSATEDMTSARADHKSVFLDDGRLFIYGGKDEKGLCTGSSEIFDPATTTFTETASGRSRQGHAMVKLDDGNVVAFGGWRCGGSQFTYFDLYDVGSDSWQNLYIYEDGFFGKESSGILLSNNRILCTGSDRFLIFNVTTREVEYVQAGYTHGTGLYRLNSDSIMIFGGGFYDYSAVVDVRYFSDKNVKMSLVADEHLANQRSEHQFVTLGNGNVFVVGGISNNSRTFSATFTELFNPVDFTWSAGADCEIKSEYGSLTELPNGNALRIGNTFTNGFRYNVYDYDSDTWSERVLAPEEVNFSEHDAVLLNDGRVLVTGGSYYTDPENNPTYQKPTAKAWIIDPEAL